MRDRVEGKILSLICVEIAVLVGRDWEVVEGIYQTDQWKCGFGVQNLKLDRWFKDSFLKGMKVDEILWG